MQLFFAEKGDFSNKKRPKRDLKSGLDLLRDPGLPKRDPVGRSGISINYFYYYHVINEGDLQHGSSKENEETLNTDFSWL